MSFKRFLGGSWCYTTWSVVTNNGCKVVCPPPTWGVNRFGQETICTLETLEGDFLANFVKPQKCASDHTSLWLSDCRHWPVGVDCSRQLILGRCPLGTPPQLWLPAWAEEWSPQQSLPTTTSQAGRWSASSTIYRTTTRVSSLLTVKVIFTKV